MPAWPWQAMMITAVNCFLLWAFTWLQFVITLSSFSYHGENLWFYTVTDEHFHMTIPELFLAFSLALSLFAIVAVMGATWKEPRLWKRVLAVSIFAIIAIGLSGSNLHLRHFCYEQAVAQRTELMQFYRRAVSANYQTANPDTLNNLTWSKEKLFSHDRILHDYRKKYGLPDAY